MLPGFVQESLFFLSSKQGFVLQQLSNIEIHKPNKSNNTHAFATTAFTDFYINHDLKPQSSSNFISIFTSS